MAALIGLVCLAVLFGVLVAKGVVNLPEGEGKPAASAPAKAAPNTNCEKITRDQIRSLATEAGWQGNNVNIAVAVALAESGGNTCSKGDVSLENAEWGPSIGLWQIRSQRNQKGTGNTRDELANYDRHINAQHAYQIWKGEGGSWQPWSTWNNGAYLKYM